LLKLILGTNGQTVIRGGSSIAYTREGFNAFTSMFGSNEGPTLTLDNSPLITPFIFPAGSVLFRDSTFPSLPLPTDVSRLPLTPGAGTGGGGANDFDPKMKAGYAASYSFGIQRQLGKSTVVEARIVRTRGTHLWRQYNLNEVNIFENGFLDVFKAAARNLSIYTATNPGCSAVGNCNYSNSGLPGQVDVPLITTAINSSVDLNTAVLLQQGQAGALANGIAFNLGRMNRLTTAGLIPFTTLPDGSKASNFFIVNPQTTGGAFLMTNGIDTSFNALQVELRRRLSKGLLVEGSYQFAKALSNAFVSSSSVFSQPRTLRDLRQDRTYSPWDIRHAFKLDYIYELPIGPGKRFFKGHNPFISMILGNWQIGGVARIQSGSPVLLTGGRMTFNQFDAGVILHNMTQAQLQDMVKVRKESVCDASGCRGVVYYLPGSLIQNTLAAFDLSGKLDPNAPYIGPPTEPGKLGQRIVLFGPWQSRFDFNAIKSIPLTERVKFEARVQFLNAFNRANFFITDPDNTVGSVSANSTSFGQTRAAYRDITVSGTNDPGGRLIEFQFRLKF
jgi:hypothetical protein